MKKKAWSLPFIALVLLSACGNPKKEATTAGTENVTDSGQQDEDPGATYQHIAVATIKDAAWNGYISAMHDNILNSRKETGNVLFNLFQPEDGAHKVAFLERFADRAAFEQHLKADYLPTKITEESLDGAMKVMELKELPEVPAVEPQNADDVAGPRNVIVFFEVKPERRQSFIDGFVEVTPYSRKAPGNIRFNIFEQADSPNKFVLVESWESVTAHEKHLAQDYSKKLDAVLDGAFVSNPADTRWLAKDISK